MTSSNTPVALIAVLLIAAVYAKNIHIRQSLPDFEEHEDYVRTSELEREINRAQKEMVVGLLTGTLPADVRDALLNKHNALRKQEGVTADMYLLHWSDTLASWAQTWAEGCNYVHGFPSPLNYSGLSFDSAGQNIYYNVGYGMGADVAVSAIQLFYDEKVDYDYDARKCATGKKCGHYTQIVWGATRELGCAFVFCPVLNTTKGLKNNANFLVCNYGPGGNAYNYDGIAYPPYSKAESCTKCFKGKMYCNDGFCDDFCTADGPTCTCTAQCHCGTRIDSNCTCKCHDGYTGVDCTVICKDYHSNCGYKYGWPNKSWCQYSFVRDECPKFCGVCTPLATEAPCTSNRSVRRQVNEFVRRWHDNGDSNE